MLGLKLFWARKKLINKRERKPNHTDEREVKISSRCEMFSVF